MKVFKSLLIGLFLAYPFLSVATVFVQCRSSYTGPSPYKTGGEGVLFTGNCTLSGKSIWHNELVGFSDSFSEAWDDAVSTCNIILRESYSPDGQKTTAHVPPEYSAICDINECFSVGVDAPIYAPLFSDWLCYCFEVDRYVENSMPLGGCQETASIVYSFFDVTSFGGMHKKAGQFCREKAMEQNKKLSVFCRPKTLLK